MSTIATSAVADCRRHLLNMLDTVLRELGFRDEAWIARALDAAGQRYDELTGVRDRRGFDAVRSLTASRISLIHEDDLAYTIDLSDLARRLREACAPSLVRVHLRLLSALGQSDLEPEMSPLAPETACEALRALADAADLPAEARARLLVRAEQPLRQALTGLYATLDTLLAAAGVTPPPSRPSTAATHTRRTGGSSDGGGLGSLRHSLAGPSATPTTSAPAVDPRRLAEAIERLEARLAGTTPGDAHELRLGLREIAGLLTPDRALAIEVVDALFQVIADDTAVPADLRQHLAALTRRPCAGPCATPTCSTIPTAPCSNCSNRPSGSAAHCPPAGTAHCCRASALPSTRWPRPPTWTMLSVATRKPRSISCRRS